MESYHVDTHITEGLTGGFYKGRHVFTDGALSAHISMLADTGKLLNAAETTNDGIVAHFHMSCELHTIGQDHMVAHDTVVCHVRIGHEEAMAADHRFPFIL